MRRNTPLLAALALLSTVSTVPALITGQIDTFEDGTTQGWVINLLGMGAPPPAALPINVASGGPAGIDDNYLLLTSVGGQGAGGRLNVINFMSQWAGDYIAAGIGAIRMDAQNLGQSDLSLRLLFADPTVGPPANVAISAVPIVIPAGTDWTLLSFSISPADLLALSGDVETALRNATELRIFHSVDSAFPGPEIVAQLGVDNIQALAQQVPDAGLTSLLMACGFLFTALFKKRSQAYVPLSGKHR